MAVGSQPDTETSADRVPSKDFKALQIILATQGEAVSYKEVADLGSELLGFFEALGAINEPTKDSYA